MSKDFAFESMRVRMAERRLLSQSTMDRLVQSQDLSEALQILRETRYSDAFGKVDHPEQFEEALSLEMDRQAQFIHDLAKEEGTIHLLFLKYDYHNLKILIKEMPDLSENGTGKAELSDKPEEAEENPLMFRFTELFLPEVKGWIQQPASNPRETIQQKAIFEARESWLAHKDSRELDFILDRAYFEELRQVAGESKSAFFEDYARTLTDYTNLLSFFRARKQGQSRDFLARVFMEKASLSSEEAGLALHASDEEVAVWIKDSKLPEFLKEQALECLKTSRITEFEKQKDEYAYHKAVKGNEQLSGPEVLFGYMVRVETEIQNLRIILSGKRAELEAETLKERMRR